MTLNNWTIKYYPEWDKYFKKFDSNIQITILKKIKQMKQDQKPRRLHRSNYLVEEVGQYRIAYIVDDVNLIKKIHFIGNHKQYEKWYRNLE
jgi:mRNA-degrading endonuclease RelE of RelBE toxin-antitoxin system